MIFAAGSSAVTKEFQAYYKSVTGKEVALSMRYCIIVRDAGCPACRSVVARKMMSKEFRKHCSFVACAEDANEITAQIAQGTGFVDQSCSSQRLSFALPISYCVKLADGKVTSIVPITMDQLDKLFD